MRGGIQSYFPVVLMALLAALTFWLARMSEVEPGPRDGRARHDPDFTIENFTVRRFDTQGRLQHVIEAKRMTHFPDNDSTELVEPRGTALGGAAPLTMSAHRGTVGPDGKVVVLRGDVVLRRAAAQGVAPGTFTTTELTAYPEDEYFTTAAPVTITQGHSVMRGTGFELNNNTQNAVLHSQVRATFTKDSP